MEKLKSWFTTRNGELLFLAMALIYLYFLGSREYEAWLKKDNRTKVESTLSIYRDAAESYLKSRIFLIDGLERFVVERDDRQIERDFLVFAPGLHNNLEGVRNIGLAPNGVLEFVYPLRGNEQALNHNLFADNTPSIKADISKAMESRMVVVSDPYQLRQGGLGVVVRKAIFKGDKFWGFVAMVIDLPVVLELSGIEKGGENFNLAIRDKNGRVFWGDKSVFQANPVMMRIGMFNNYWEIGGLNIGGWSVGVNRPLSVFRIVSLMIAVLIWLLFALLLGNKTGLVIAEGKLSEKTRSVKIVIIYVGVSVLWVLLSDKGLAAVFTDPQLINEMQSIKGVMFVIITSLLLYWLIETNYGRYLITSRALRTILESNRILVRARDETKLFQGICDELVMKSGYEMAWVGVKREGTSELFPIGKSGKIDNFFEDVEMTWITGWPESPCAESVLTGKTVIVNDVSKVKKYPEWRLGAEKRNFRSMISLPLIDNGSVVGILAIYSSKVKAFTFGDLELLTGFADDLVFGLKVITANKLIESEKKKLEVVLNDLGDAVFTTDQNGRVTMVNKVMEKLTGVEGKILRGKSFREMRLVFEKKDDPGDELVERILCDGLVVTQSKHLELINNRGEKIAVDFVGTPIKDEAGKVMGCVVVLRDVTKQRRLESIKTDFNTMVSHQLRSPLTGIKWFVQLLLEQVDSMKPKKIKEYISKIGESNQRLIEFVNDLLETSRNDEGGYDPKKNEPVKVKKILADSYKLVERKYEERRVKLLGVDEIPEEFEVRVDKIQMVQVFFNLLDNAVNYSPRGSGVVVKVISRGKYIQISIKDEGVGIPLKQQNKVFEKFFRADNVMKTSNGNGLGLYVTKNIVENHGGKIWFTTKNNKGTTFYVKLLTKQT